MDLQNNTVASGGLGRQVFIPWWKLREKTWQAIQFMQVRTRCIDFNNITGILKVRCILACHLEGYAERGENDIMMIIQWPARAVIITRDPNGMLQWWNVTVNTTHSHWNGVTCNALIKRVIRSHLSGISHDKRLQYVLIRFVMLLINHMVKNIIHMVSYFISLNKWRTLHVFSGQKTNKFMQTEVYTGPIQIKSATG